MVSSGAGISIIVVKLNITNYILWSKAVEIYVIVQGKEKYFSKLLLSKDLKEFTFWWKENTMVMTCLWNIMESHITSTAIFINRTRQIWDALRQARSGSEYFQNLWYILHALLVNRVINLSEHYGILEGLCEELNVFLAVFHSLINNLEIFCKCREEFRAAKFLSNLILVYESSKIASLQKQSCHHLMMHMLVLKNRVIFLCFLSLWDNLSKRLYTLLLRWSWKRKLLTWSRIWWRPISLQLLWV